jgi:hypothetical protein
MAKYLKPALEKERIKCLEAIEHAIKLLGNEKEIGIYGLGTINGLRLAKLQIELMPEVTEE